MFCLEAHSTPFQRRRIGSIFLRKERARASEIRLRNSLPFYDKKSNRLSGSRDGRVQRALALFEENWEIWRPPLPVLFGRPSNLAVFLKRGLLRKELWRALGFGDKFEPNFQWLFRAKGDRS